MESTGRDSEKSTDGKGDVAYIAGILVTFAAGALVMATDDDFGRAYQASENGDTVDRMLYPGMVATWVAIWLLQLVLGAAMTIIGSAWLERRLPVIAWILPALWLGLYLLVFRPRG